MPMGKIKPEERRETPATGKRGNTKNRISLICILEINLIKMKRGLPF